MSPLTAAVASAHYAAADAQGIRQLTQDPAALCNFHIGIAAHGAVRPRIVAVMIAAAVHAGVPVGACAHGAADRYAGVAPDGVVAAAVYAAGHLAGHRHGGAPAYVALSAGDGAGGGVHNLLVCLLGVALIVVGCDQRAAVTVTAAVNRPARDLAVAGDDDAGIAAHMPGAPAAANNGVDACASVDGHRGVARHVTLIAAAGDLVRGGVDGDLGAAAYVAPVAAANHVARCGGAAHGNGGAARHVLAHAAADNRLISARI